VDHETDRDVRMAIQKAVHDLEAVQTGVDGADADRDDDRKLREENLIASMEEQVFRSSHNLWAGPIQ
jgi:hypothetical protein